MTRSGRALSSTLALCVAVTLALPAAASAHAYLTKTVPAASVELESPPPSVQLTYDEAVEPRFALISVTDVNAHQVTDGYVSRSPANPDTLVVPAEEGAAGVVPRLLARDLRRRTPRARRVHLRGRPEPWPAASVRDPPHRADGDLDSAAHRAVGRVPDGHDRDRAVRVANPDRAAARRASRRNFAAQRLDRVLRAPPPRGDRAPRVPGGVGFDRLAAVILLVRRARPALAHDRVRPRVVRPLDLLPALRASRPRFRSGSTGRSSHNVRSRHSWPCPARCLRRRPC